MTAPLIDALSALGGVTITVRHPLQPASQRLMDTLGVTVLIDPRAPACARDTAWTAGMGKQRRACLKCAELDGGLAG